MIAQGNIEFDDKNFSDHKAFKEAKRHYDAANNLFSQANDVQAGQLKFFISKNHYLPNGINELQGAGMEGYKMALAEYLQANAFNPSSSL